MFNPSSMDRLLHVILGAYLAAAFVVLSVSAFYLIRGRFREIAVSSMKIGLVVAALASLLQLASGHRSAGVVVDHQPAKLAAFEGLFETQAQAPLHLEWGLAASFSATHILYLTGEPVTSISVTPT